MCSPCPDRGAVRACPVLRIRALCRGASCAVFSLFLLPDHSPEHSVDKSGELLFAVFLGQLDRLIACGGIRNSIHVQDLKDSHLQNVADHGADARSLFDMSSDYVAQLDPALDHALCQSFDKSSLPPVHALPL